MGSFPDGGLRGAPNSPGPGTKIVQPFVLVPTFPPRKNPPRVIMHNHTSHTSKQQATRTPGECDRVAPGRRRCRIRGRRARARAAGLATAVREPATPRDADGSRARARRRRGGGGERRWPRPSSPPRMRRPVALRPARRVGPRTLTGGGMATDQFVGGDPRGRRRHVLRGVASPRRSPAPPPRGRARRPWGLLFPADATTRGTAMRETSPRARRRAGRRERRGRTGRLRHGGRRLRGRNRAHAGGRGRSRGGRGPEWMGCPGVAAAEEAVGWPGRTPPPRTRQTDAAARTGHPWR